MCVGLKTAFGITKLPRNVTKSKLQIGDTLRLATVRWVEISNACAWVVGPSLTLLRGYSLTRNLFTSRRRKHLSGAAKWQGGSNMLSKASPGVKTKVRSFLGIGDVFLITKESENASVTKYKKQAESEKDRADALAQEVAELRKLAGSNGVKKGPAELTTSAEGKSPTRRFSWIEDSLAEDPLPKDADSAKTRSWEVLVAVLLVLAAQALGYTAGLSHAQSLGQNTLASGGGTLAHLVTGDGPDFVNDALDLGDDAIDGATTTLKATTTAMGGILVTKHGQATTLSIALVLSSIVLAPMMLTRAGSRVVMVLTAAMPTAYVWLLPVAAKLGFANSMEVLMSHGEADVVGVMTTPQATGWMVALYSLPLFALLRIADVGGRGPQYKDRSMDAGGRGPLRSTGVATVVLFYLWLLVGCWMRAPVRATLMNGSNQPHAHAPFHRRSISPRASAGSLQLPGPWRDQGGEHGVPARRWPPYPPWR